MPTFEQLWSASDQVPCGLAIHTRLCRILSCPGGGGGGTVTVTIISSPGGYTRVPCYAPKILASISIFVKTLKKSTQTVELTVNNSRQISRTIGQSLSLTNFNCSNQQQFTAQNSNQALKTLVFVLETNCSFLEVRLNQV